MSGSVDMGIAREFISEVQGAIASVDHVTGTLHTFDTRLYTICDIADLDPSTFQGKGGGGTCFKPIWKNMEKSDPAFSRTLHLILTDGYADLNLPTPPDDASVLWCISPGGLGSEELPHGDVVRIMK